LISKLLIEKDTEFYVQEDFLDNEG